MLNKYEFSMAASLPCLFLYFQSNLIQKPEDKELYGLSLFLWK